MPGFSPPCLSAWSGCHTWGGNNLQLPQHLICIQLENFTPSDLWANQMNVLAAGRIQGSLRDLHIGLNLPVLRCPRWPLHHRPRFLGLSGHFYLATICYILVCAPSFSVCCIFGNFYLWAADQCQWASGKFSEHPHQIAQTDPAHKVVPYVIKSNWILFQFPHAQKKKELSGLQNNIFAVAIFCS